MNIFGIELQQVPVLLGIAAVMAFHIAMLIDLWSKPSSLFRRVVWSVVILAMPFVGAFLYWWFVKRTNTALPAN